MQFGTTRSRLEPMICGVPQGSILSPLLFMIYINGLPNASDMVKTLLFADDTSLFHSHKDPDQTISVMNCGIRKIMCRLNANKLSLNIAKTNYFLFRSKQKRTVVNDNITLTISASSRLR